MRYRYRTRKINILIEVFKEDILIKADNKHGTLISMISDTEDEYKEDVRDLISFCPTRSARKWVRSLDWYEVTKCRYCMSDVEFTKNLFKTMKHG